MKRLLILGVVAALLLTFSRPALARDYTFTYLPNLPGASGVYATGLNNNGQAVGVSYASSYQAVLWSGGQVQALPGLGGISSATDINDNGEIVGSVHYANQGNGARAHWDSGGNLSMWEPPDWSGYQYVDKISNTGRMLGVVGDRSWAWDGPNTVGFELPFQASGINNLGQIVGRYSTGVNLWNSGAVTYIELGTYVQGICRINDLGQIAWQAGSTVHFFDGTQVHSRHILGLGGIAGLNNLGQVAGFIIGGDGTGFVWDSEEGMSTFEAWRVNDINDRGQVLGMSRGSGVFIATPKTPIPGAVWLLGSGLAGLFGWRRKYGRS